MIEIVQGQGLGAGKSYFVTAERVVPHMIRGGTVFCTSNFELRWPEFKKYVLERYGLILEDRQYNPVDASDTWRIHEITPPGSEDCPVLIILDECHAQLNARDWADPKKRAMFDFCTQSRHDDTDLIFISQNAHNIDKQVARLATFIWNIKNGQSLPAMLLAFLPWFKNRFLVNQYGQDGKTQIDKKFITKDKRIFGIYVSKTMRGSHKRSSQEAVKKLQLQKVKKKMKLLPTLLIGGLLLALCAGGKMIYDFKNKGLTGAVAKAPDVQSKAETVTAPLSKPAAPPADCCGSYDIVSEQLRGTDYQTYLRTDQATYLKGQMSPRGFVVGIQGLTARLENAKGRTVFVVAQDVILKSDINQPGIHSPAPVVPAQSSRTVAAAPMLSNPKRFDELTGWQDDSSKVEPSAALTDSTNATPRQRVMPIGAPPATAQRPQENSKPAASKITIKDATGRVTVL